MDRFSETMRTLAAVRPIGMNDDMASDLVAVIIAEAVGLNDSEFSRGCERARRECTDHRQLLKTIMQGDPELTEWKRKMDAYSVPFMADHSPRKSIELSGGNEAERLIGRAAKARRVS